MKKVAGNPVASHAVATQGAREVELWPLGRLRPYEHNPRTHSAEQVEKIAASISEFGFTNPVLVDGEGGVIAGHGRLLAAQRLGLLDVPVIQLGYLSDAQKRAYVIADNRLALDAGWDDDLLAEELERLRADGFDLGATGFSDKELADILGEAPAGEELEEPPRGSAYQAQFGVIVVCENEEEQAGVYERLTGQGLKCRVVTT